MPEHPEPHTCISCPYGHHPHSISPACPIPALGIQGLQEQGMALLGDRGKPFCWHIPSLVPCYFTQLYSRHTIGDIMGPPWQPLQGHCPKGDHLAGRRAVPRPLHCPGTPQPPCSPLCQHEVGPWWGGVSHRRLGRGCPAARLRVPQLLPALCPGWGVWPRRQRRMMAHGGRGDGPALSGDHLGSGQQQPWAHT